MKKALTTLALLAITGCAIPDYNYVPTLANISQPANGSINTAHVGDVMLRKGKYTESDAITLSTTVNVGAGYALTPGHYLKQGEDPETETFLPENSNTGGKIHKPLMGAEWQAIMIYKGTNKLCLIMYSGGYICNENARFSRSKRPLPDANSFQQTLIYSGKIGNKINIGYRELSNSIARPAFNNDVEYDLSESTTIGYKGAKLEVLKATNESIQYKVISNFQNTGI